MPCCKSVRELLADHDLFRGSLDQIYKKPVQPLRRQYHFIGFAENKFFMYRTDKPGVRAIVSIIAQHEIVVLRHHNRTEISSWKITIGL